MMPKGFPKPCPDTYSLLGWTPPEPAIRFEADEVRAKDIQTKIARAVSAALRQSRIDRSEVAARMSEYLGKEVSLHTLNAYASQEKPHEITHTRLIALAHALQDWRLLSIGAEELECIVVPASYGELIRYALIQDHIKGLQQELDGASVYIKKLVEGGN
ncbi:MAG: DNA transposition protein [Alphaproteobacteria bacterium]|nr:DNA transposition protein [Alphaproteobacteria bacterium]